MSPGSHKIRCGDYVHHAPTGESWVVAYANYETGKLAWAGWPEGMAELADCTLERATTDEEHEAAVARWAAPRRTTEDHRTWAVRRLYPEAWAKAEAKAKAQP